MAREVQYDLFGEPYCYDPDRPEDGYFVELESTSEDDYDERIEWCHGNTKGGFSPTVAGFTFSTEEDAGLFRMRWL